MSTETLWITQHEPDNLPVESPDELFVIDEALGEAPTARVFELIHTLYRLDIRGSSEFPLYDIMKNYRVAVPSTKYNLVASILMTEKLSKLVEIREPDWIRCGNIRGIYLSAVLDVCEQYDIEMHDSDESGKTAVMTYLAAVTKARNSLADTVLSACRNVIGGSVEPTETAILPRLDRFGTIRPVIDELSSDVALFDTENRDPLSPGEVYPSPDGHDSTSLHSLATLSDVFEMGRFLFRDLPADLLVDDGRSKLAETLEIEAGLPMEHATDYVVHNLYRRAIEAKLYALLSGRLLEETECEKVVVNAIGITELALIREIGDSVDVYFVPHGAISGYEEVLPGDPHRFVEGKAENRYLAKLEYTPKTGSSSVVGLPKLSRYHQNYFDATTTGNETVRVVIATQPVASSVRRQFVSTILNSLSKADRDFDPIIKIHPEENISFYAPIRAEADGNVKISDGNLLGHLRNADVVVTLESNSGLEAIAIGTPCVSLNLWHPLILVKPYISCGPVPQLTSVAESDAFFRELDRDTLSDMAERQLEFLVEDQDLKGDPAVKMAEKIDT